MAENSNHLILLVDSGSELHSPEGRASLCSKVSERQLGRPERLEVTPMTGLELSRGFSPPTSSTGTEMTHSLYSEVAVNQTPTRGLSGWLGLEGAARGKHAERKHFSRPSQNDTPLSLHSSGWAGHSGQFRFKGGAPRLLLLLGRWPEPYCRKAHGQPA